MFAREIIFFVLLSVATAERIRVSLQMLLILSLFSLQVVSGEDAPVGNYPFIVSVQAHSEHVCAGSIIDERWILTAAHCIWLSPYENLLRVKAGKHDLLFKELNEQIVQVEQVFVHENYDGKRIGRYNIGLLKLASPLKFTKQVQPVELALPESEPTGEAWLCGWDSMSSGPLRKMPDKLQQIKMKYINRTTCYEAIENLMGSYPIYETNICTKPFYNGISACSGDSGGPLISRNGEKSILTGIVSWGSIPCDTEGAPTIYTRVSKFNNWILEKTNNY